MLKKRAAGLLLLLLPKSVSPSPAPVLLVNLLALLMLAFLVALEGLKRWFYRHFAAA